MEPRIDEHLALSRRRLLSGLGSGLGAAALATLLPGVGHAAGSQGPLTSTHHAPRARRVIYLMMSGAPSQIDLWDPKPALREFYDRDLPDSVRMGQRITSMTSDQARLPIAPSIYRFKPHGESGIECSDLLPHTAGIVDRLCLVRSLYTESINHDPGMTFLQTGHEQSGRPSLGAWLSYGLGSLNRDLPTYVVLHARWSARREAQALFSRLWSTGFLPTRHQGVTLRSQGDAVLYLGDPPGLERAARREQLDALGALNRLRLAELGDPEIAARIAQYEMAFRMQASVPELTDVSGEPAHVLDLYGPDVHQPGSFAHCCLLARRMVERDVRFVQVYHRGWDHHDNLPRDLPLQCRDIDQACAALVLDLEQRGLLEDTLVVWTGEFGRTVYCQGALTPTTYGRDHHPRCFSGWLAGGGVKAGYVHGETDEFSYNIVRDPVHVHDLNATLLHLLGVDHERLTFRYAGRDFRLTDVHGALQRALLA